MASSLSAKFGSLLTLKLSPRCGFSPLARQMRDTEAFEMPISRAIVRVDHCVALGGRLSVGFAINLAGTAEPLNGVRPGRGASFKSPSIPCLRNRPRHNAAIRG